MIDYSKLNENEISDLAENLSIEGSENSLYSLSVSLILNTTSFHFAICLYNNYIL